ncbi:hypothetical protein, partial [Shewanella algae]|uniref:hypothetical protein n=1 Tax=Shewanella algae TaxID=38313 RepID=UPI003AAC4239
AIWALFGLSPDLTITTSIGGGFGVTIKNRKPTNRFPMVSHLEDRSTDPYLIYVAVAPTLWY